ncbi:MAG: ferritin-like domain-containing protein [Solirubrobacterales bacterium]|nr:ferritin-like domain-containing protein [Solirubrobacterales bacterium]
MSEFLNSVYQSVDEQHADKSAATRRQVVGGAAAALGSMGMLAWAQDAEAQLPTSNRNDAPNTVETIAAVAATAEVLATIVNTVGGERVPLDAVTTRNIRAAATEEKIHYEVLISDAVGGVPITKRIWVPNEVFASPTNLLTTLVVGDQVFINAYLLAGTVFARAGGLSGSRFARFAAEFMGAEAVHRALALQSLGRLGNDRVFMKFGQREAVTGLPTTGQPGFYRITDAVTILESAGFGFGKQGSKPGAFFEYDEVSRRTPTVEQTGVNTLTPS